MQTAASKTAFRLLLFFFRWSFSCAIDYVVCAEKYEWFFDKHQAVLSFFNSTIDRTNDNSTHIHYMSTGSTINKDRNNPEKEIE